MLKLFSTLLVLCVAALSLTSLASCSSSESGDPNDPSAGKIEGFVDTMVYYRIYPSDKVRGNESGIKLKPFYSVLLNQSHSRFKDHQDGMQPLNLAREERVLRDNLMEQLLEVFSDQDFFEAGEGSQVLLQNPNKLIDGMPEGSKPERYIAVVRGNRGTIFMRPPTDKVSNADMLRRFRACEDAFRASLNLSEQKAATKIVGDDYEEGEGITGDDFKNAGNRYPDRE